ncbi:MAG: protein kinase [Planctomycetota bacterium]
MTLPRLGERYQLLAELGRGAMGVVYRALDVELGREVALKVLLDLGAAGQEERARFAAEARATARLEHPHIVRVLDARLDLPQPFLVMELVHGESLGRLVSTSGPLEPVRAARLVRDLADALAHAHAQGVLHRDLKPANVLLEGEAPRLTDFGLARIQAERGLTQTGTVVGTPSYMAPEQADGRKQDIGPCTDVYGLGATLYHLLAGRPPFAGPTAYHTMSQVIGDPPEPLRALRPEVPPDLDALCARCLEKDPAARFPSAASLRDALDEHLARGRADQASPPAPGRRGLGGPGLGLALGLLLGAGAGALGGFVGARALDRGARAPGDSGGASSPGEDPAREGLAARVAALEGAAREAEAARAASAERRARALRALLDEAAAQAGKRAEHEREDLLWAALDLEHPGAAEALSARLAQIAGDLLDARDRASRSQGASQALDAALAARRRAAPGESLSAAHTRALVEAERRVVAASSASGGRQDRYAVGAAQEQALGAGPLVVAELCCRALGRWLGRAALRPELRAQGLAALAAYARAEADPRRGAEAVIALARVGTPDAQRLLPWAAGLVRADTWARAKVTPFLPKGAADEARDDAQAELLRARDLLREGREDEALEALAQAIERDPRGYQALIERAQLRRKRGELDAAAQDLAAVRTRLPRHVAAQIEQAALTLDQGDPSGAWKQASDVLAQRGYERQWTARLVRARARLCWRDLGEARADLEAALSLGGSSDVEVLSTLVRVVTLQRDAKRAAELVTRLRQLAPQAPQSLGAAALLDGLQPARRAAAAGALRALPADDGPALLLRGELELILGDAAGAIADLERLVAREPQRGLAWLLLARAYRGDKSQDPVARGRAGLAAQPLARGLEVEELSALAALGRREELASAYAAALRRRPVDPEALFLYAQQTATTQPARALEALAQLERLREVGARERALEGRALHASGNLSGALEAYADSLRRDPTSVATGVQRAVLLVSLNRPKDAREACDELLRLTPDEVHLLGARSQALAALKELDGALQDADRVERLGNPGYAHCLRGRAYLIAGRHTDALREADAAAKDPGAIALSAVWLLRAEVLAGMGRRADALKQLDELDAKFPGAAQSAELRRKLGK